MLSEMPQKCDSEPLPGDAYGVLPLARHQSTSCLSVVAPVCGPVAMGVRRDSPT